jgi:hypothetical protein
MAFPIVDGLLKLLSSGAEAVSAYFKNKMQQRELANTPEMKKGAEAQVSQQDKDKGRQDIADATSQDPKRKDKGLEELRKDTSE